MSRARCTETDASATPTSDLATERETIERETVERETIEREMKTIEERAKEYSGNYPPYYQSKIAYDAYIEGATEQMQIDIEKACEWLEKWSDAFASDYGMNDSFVKEFRKAMEDA